MGKDRTHLTKSKPGESSKSNDPVPKGHKPFLEFAKGSVQVLTKEVREDLRTGVVKVINTDSPIKVLLEHVRSNTYADVAVTVKNHSFMCHSLVLCAHSKLMAKKLNSGSICFNTPKLSAKGFSQAYKWITSDHYNLDCTDFIDVLRAAYYLEMPDLIKYCWKILDSPMFNEVSAFSILYESRHAPELSKVHKLMATRISQSLMRVAASHEFLCLSERQVCSLLKSNSLAVNSEMEVLYCALLWLNHLWPKRRSCTQKILKNIRFGFLSPTMLSKFKTQDRNNIGCFGPILTVFSQLPGLGRLIQDALFYSSLIITSHKDPKCLEENIEYNQIKLIDPRQWISDSKCGYHRIVTRMCPNMRYVTFRQFKEYLYHQQNIRNMYDKAKLYAVCKKKDGIEVVDYLNKPLSEKQVFYERLAKLSLSQYTQVMNNNFSPLAIKKKKAMKSEVIQITEKSSNSSS
ncbi:kelch-like protein 3 [Drosophila rhopaloa]|uniref:Kelch-like protein 3 n=1 Tax=Drosophila rhopaloa TaxID=1041015 RepID=A0A6P4EFF9_DRORH|nr:kelch-like protein 3 [Drosophila rhopaloa]